MQKLILATMLLGCAAVPGFSGDRGYDRRDLDKSILSERTKTYEEEDVFKAKEWQFDLFANYADTDGDGGYQDGWGGGLGANYFWDRYFGAGLEAYWWEGAPGDNWLHNVGANLFARYPLDDLRLAPYVFIGPGGHFNGEAHASGHAGGGIEWRLMEHLGWFADARYTFTSGPLDFGLYRTGLRFAF